jgi:magnesium chelatase family protein
LLDRIDLVVEVPVQPSEIHNPGEPATESSARVAQRVKLARERAIHAQSRINALLEPGLLHEQLGATLAAQRLLATAADRLGWSARGLHRVWRIARTIADLADLADLAKPGSARPPVEAAHVAEAIQYRRGLTAVPQGPV